MEGDDFRVYREQRDRIVELEARVAALTAELVTASETNAKLGLLLAPLTAALEQIGQHEGECCYVCTVSADAALAREG